jgi:hypothetical protein
MNRQTYHHCGYAYMTNFWVLHGADDMVSTEGHRNTHSI